MPLLAINEIGPRVFTPKGRSGHVKATSLPPKASLEVSCERGEIFISVPLADLPEGNLYVFTEPSSIGIEVRWMSRVPHDTGDGVVYEVREQRETRHIECPFEIAEKTLTTEVEDRTLLIRARRKRV
jgi:hypothetical protein